jgi:hypothetical protein
MHGEKYVIIQRKTNWEARGCNLICSSIHPGVWLQWESKHANHQADQPVSWTRLKSAASRSTYPLIYFQNFIQLFVTELITWLPISSALTFSPVLVFIYSFFSFHRYLLILSLSLIYFPFQEAVGVVSCHQLGTVFPLTVSKSFVVLLSTSFGETVSPSVRTSYVYIYIYTRIYTGTYRHSLVSVTVLHWSVISSTRWQANK